MTEKKRIFADLISELRVKRGARKVNLSEGICSNVIYQYYEDGICYPPLLIRKRLLDRFGASKDNRIVLVNFEDLGK